LKKAFNLSGILVSVLLCSCSQNHNNTATNKIVNDKPKSELAFLKEINTVDSIYNSQNNAITQKDALDSGKTRISNFIINKLSGKIENWPAVVHSIQSDNDIEVTFMVQKGADTSEYKSLILSSKINSDNIQIKNQLKPLSYGDSVLITGAFEKNAIGNIDFKPYNILSIDGDSFSNPKFSFDIKSIKKK
jgi:hypothetical protein